MMSARVICVLVWLTAATVCANPATRPNGNGQAVAEFLQTNSIHTVSIRVSAAGWETMQPLMASRFAMLMGVPQHPVPERRKADVTTRPAGGAGTTRPGNGKIAIEGQRHAPSPFGYEFAYVRATVEIDGEELRDVGVRFKGNYSYRNAATLKRPFKLDFERFVPGRKFRGLESVNLHNNVGDPSQLREALAYAVFRDAGVPAPRTSFAMVYLTIEGQLNHEFIGLYNFVEAVDKRFLREHFQTSDGLLLKPEQTRNLPYLGEDWDDYLRYRPQTDPTPMTARRFIEFTKLIHHADDERFVSEIWQFIDIDNFARFLAVNALTINLDSFLNGSHNVYIYVHPESGRIYFMPWDMHLSFASAGAARQDGGFANLSIEQPYLMPNRLLERLMAIEMFRQAYFGFVRESINGIFSPQVMQARYEQMRVVVDKAEQLFRDYNLEGSPTTQPAMLRRTADLPEFFVARAESVLKQLAGQTSGYAPGTRPPRPERPLVRPRPSPLVRDGGRIIPPIRGRGAPVAPPVAPPVAASANPVAAARSAAANLGSAMIRNLEPSRSGSGISRQDADAAVRLFYLLVEPADARGLSLDELIRGYDRVDRLLDPAPQPLSPDDNPQPRDDPANPRPAVLWAKITMKLADANQDGKLSRDEMLAAAMKFFKQWDANGNGVLLAAELYAGLEKLLLAR